MAIKSWMVIGAIVVAIAFGMTRLCTPDGYRWFNRQRRPQWLTFEGLIPAIWSLIFIFGAWSAVLTWEATSGNTQGRWLMAGYACVEVLIMAYSPVMFALRSLKVGTFIGGIGWVVGAMLAAGVYPVSTTAVGLLIPYLLWSPIGTYVTWEMWRINR
jgi:translocator protein